MVGDHFLTDSSRLSPGDAAAAIIVFDDGRYLLQLRDNKEGIFFPGHWGLFGGAIEEVETNASALLRELKEELGVSVTDFTHLMGFEFDLQLMWRGKFMHSIFEVRLPLKIQGTLNLMEGERMGTFSKQEVLQLHPVTPYDAFAIWCHTNRERINSK